MWIDKGNVMIEMVHVENVAEAIALACLKGKNKDIFFITDDEPKTSKEFISDLLAVNRITIPDKSIPGVIARPLVSLIEKIWRVFKLKSNPPLTRFDLSFLAMARQYNIHAAKEVLGYKPVVTYKAGLEQMKRQSK